MKLNEMDLRKKPESGIKYFDKKRIHRTASLIAWQLGTRFSDREFEFCSLIPDDNVRNYSQQVRDGRGIISERIKIILHFAKVDLASKEFIYIDYEGKRVFESLRNFIFYRTTCYKPGEWEQLLNPLEKEARDTYRNQYAMFKV